MTDSSRPDQDAYDPSVGSAVVGELGRRADRAAGPGEEGVEPVREATEARQIEVDQEAAAGPSVGDDGQAGFSG